jgi:hypothetical protein
MNSRRGACWKCTSNPISTDGRGGSGNASRYFGCRLSVLRRAVRASPRERPEVCRQGQGEPHGDHTLSGLDAPYLGQKRAGVAIFQAVTKVVSLGKDVTYDLGGTRGTLGMAEAVAKLLK